MQTLAVGSINNNTSIPTKSAAPPVQRRPDQNDKVLLETSQWVANSDLKLEDKVSLTSEKHAFLQGIVVYVGKVHFAYGTWVGIQLTGPSVGKGNTDGWYKGKRYFAKVGKDNGVFAPLAKVNKRLGVRTGDPEVDKAQQLRLTNDACLADLNFIDLLVQERQLATRKLAQEGMKRRSSFNSTSTDDQVEAPRDTKLKRLRLKQIMHTRGQKDNIPNDSRVVTFNSRPVKLKYSKPGSKLCPADLALVDGLETTQQNFCLTDPTLPDNPITFVSQAFLNSTGYHLNEILGRNCRFLQGPDTDQNHVDRIRQAIQDGSDCHVCILNYRKDGTTFYNRLFMTALRDTKGRVKNFLGVQCQVDAKTASKINGQPVFDIPPPQQLDISDDEKNGFDSDDEVTLSGESLDGTTAPPRKGRRRLMHKTKSFRGKKQRGDLPSETRGNSGNEGSSGILSFAGKFMNFNLIAVAFQGLVEYRHEIVHLFYSSGLSRLVSSDENGDGFSSLSAGLPLLVALFLVVVASISSILTKYRPQPDKDANPQQPANTSRRSFLNLNGSGHSS